MTIRKGQTIDITTISSIVGVSYKTVATRFNLTSKNCPKHPSNCRDDWIAKDLARGVQYYLLESDSEIIGCAAIEKASSQTCYLERLAVLPTERNKGYGNKLVKHIFKEAFSKGFQTIGIGIIAEQYDLKAWYNKLGFKESGRKSFEHLPFEVQFMEYQLEASSERYG